MPEPASTALTAPRFALGAGAAAYDAAVERARDGRVGRPVCSTRDVRLWSSDERVGEAIAERLGWLDAPAHFADRIAGLEGFGDAVRRRGLHDGRRRRHGRQQPRPGRPPPDVRHRSRAISTLRILDSTDPAYVSATRRRPRPAPDALSSSPRKSGTTTEPNAFLAYAWARAEAALDRPAAPRATSSPASYFAAITDPGKSVEAIAHHDDFREVFLNPPDIGGRYSALTYVGLVPASLIGIDLDALLASASAMARRLPRAGPGSRTRACRSASRSGRWPRPAATS